MFRLFSYLTDPPLWHFPRWKSFLQYHRYISITRRYLQLIFLYFPIIFPLYFFIISEIQEALRGDFSLSLLPAQGPPAGFFHRVKTHWSSDSPARAGAFCRPFPHGENILTFCLSCLSVNFLQPFSAAWKTAEQINFHQKGNCGIKTGSRLGYDTVIKGKHEAKQEQKSLWKKPLGKVTLK